MKNDWPRRFGLSIALVGFVYLPGCSNLPSAAPSYTNTAPATVAYMIGNVDTAIEGYSTVTPSTSPTDTLSYPPSYYGGPIATDSTGQIYVAVTIDANNHPLDLEEILVYPPNSTGAPAPLRIINTSSNNVSALAVDPTGLLYVANEGTTASTVTVYSATASGAATPLRTLVLTNVGVTDIAADAAGNIYVAGPMNTEQVISVYPPTATGPAAPTRTIDFGISTVAGVAVSPAGNIFANVWPGQNIGIFAIEEFAPGANGSAIPINTINLNVGAPWTIIGGGPVRLDGAGNIFTSLFLSTNPGNLYTDVIYGYEPTASGDAAPFVQITPTDAYNIFFAVN